MNLPQDVTTVSFDVFDTVLIRNAYRPTDIHDRVARRLSDTLIANVVSYRERRMAAESIVRKINAHAEDVPLDIIISVLQQNLGITADEAAQVAEVEVSEELRSIVPIGGVKDLIEAVRKSGRTILFITDMYLPRQVVQRMLEQHGIMKQEDRLYVSGSLGLTKASGTLFRHVLDELSLRPGQLMHIGDYIWSDYFVPRWRLGIAAGLVRVARSSIYERLWGDGCDCPSCSTIAGASRAARVLQRTRQTTSTNDQILYNLGVGVLGPILLGFVLWTLQQAAADGVRRLYFLSRDGEIMLDMAKVLVRRLGIDVELRYLYVSRTAVFPALLGTQVAANTLEWLREKTIILTPRIIAERLKVDSNKFIKRLRELASFPVSPDIPLSANDLDGIIVFLITDPELVSMLKESGAIALHHLSLYLEQQGMFEEPPSALVDLGWHGGIQDAIFTCFKEKLTGKGLRGYYFGVDLKGATGNEKYGYLFTATDPKDIDRYRHLFRIIIELLCTGSHGMVRGYRNDANGRMVAITAAVEHPSNWKSAAKVRTGVFAFLEQVNLDDILAGNHEKIKSSSLDVLKKLYFQPTKDEAEALGDYFFSADQAGQGIHRVAPPFLLESAFHYLLKRSYAARSTISSWFFGSWRRSYPLLRIMLYPVVLLLYVRYLGTDTIRFTKLRLVDVINKWADVDTLSKG